MLLQTKIYQLIAMEKRKNLIREGQGLHKPSKESDLVLQSLNNICVIFTQGRIQSEGHGTIHPLNSLLSVNEVRVYS